MLYFWVAQMKQGPKLRVHRGLCSPTTAKITNTVCLSFPPDPLSFLYPCPLLSPCMPVLSLLVKWMVYLQPLFKLLVRVNWLTAEGGDTLSCALGGDERRLVWEAPPLLWADFSHHNDNEHNAARVRVQTHTHTHSHISSTSTFFTGHSVSLSLYKCTHMRTLYWKEAGS